jgi:hypothetical protein
MKAEPKKKTDPYREAYVQLRQTLRDFLFQSGVPNNPAWGDKDICYELAKLLNCKLRTPLDGERF